MLLPVYKNRHRPLGFSLSTLLHGSLFYLVVFSPSNGAVHHRSLPNHKYSVLVLRLEDFRPRRASGGEKAPGAGTHLSAPQSRTSPVEARTPANDQPPADIQSLAKTDSPSESHNRPFVLPPVPRREPVKQTLVQPDVPPDIQLTREIPLPTAILWEQLPPVRRKFVAPVARKTPLPMTQMPTAPDLSAPNRELTIADLKFASLSPVQNPKIFRPPAKTAPVKSAGIQAVTVPTQIAVTNQADTSLATLISLPDTPVIASQTIAIPPANQVASGSLTSGGNRGAGNGRGSSTGAAASHGAGNGSTNETAGRNSGSGSTGSGSSTASASTVGPGGSSSTTAGLTGSGSTNSASGSGPAGSGGTSDPGNGFGGPAFASGSAGPGSSGNGAVAIVAGSPGGDPDVRPDLPIAGTTRFTLPKEGKFTVVVAGSSAAAPYAESIGVLSGKMVYSVFISVGLRKKWILQYCLPKAEEQKSNIRGRVEPVEAPWPYTVVRPDDLGAADRQYVMVHGILNSDGRFDKLALVFPGELGRKDVLLSSLKQWAFRPASRDGVPSEVEILLIIPSQAE